MIEKRIVIHAEPETVFRALTESNSLGRWLADRAVSNPVIGGTLDIARGEGDSLDGARAIFTQIIPNRLVRIRWHARVRSGVSQSVSGDHECAFTIDANPEGVVVTMSDSESPAPSDSERLKREQTWDETLVALKSLCEGPDAPRSSPGAQPGAAAGRRASRPSRAAKPAPKKRPSKKAGAKKAARKRPKPAAKKRASKKSKSARKPAKKKAARKAARRGAKTAKKRSGRKSAKRSARKAKGRSGKTKKSARRAKKR